MQVVATNIDVVFLCISLNHNYRANRLERYLSVAWSSGATPVVVLTKADACHNLCELQAEVETLALGAAVVTTSCFDQDSCQKLLAHLAPGQTASFIGSSGVGKSTLINLLVGEERLATRAIRETDSRGRHTTTRRELILLPGGGMVIDTPGMRELGLETAEFSQTFGDLEEMASRCRFADCSHQNEPGCAIREALHSGELDPRRWGSYQKLQKEAGYEGLTSRQIETKKINAMFAGVGGMKKARDFIKEQNKRK